MIVMFAMALSPALLLAQKVSYDFNKAANFAAFKTYAQKDGTKVGQPLIDDRLAAAIDTELAAKGLTKTETNPDRVRRVSRGLRPGEGHLDLQQRLCRRLRRRTAMAGAAAWARRRTQVRNILVGTLVIDIADAKAKQIAWRGMATKELDPQAKPEKRDKNISNAVKKVFKNYPPKQKN